MSIVDRLTQQIDEAEGRTPEATVEEEVKGDIVEEQVAPEPKVSPETTTETEAATTDTKKRVSWKQRYTQMRASLENKLFQTKQELAHVKEQNILISERLQTTQEQVSELLSNKETSIDDLFTEEDKNKVGEDSLEIFKRAAEKTAANAVDPYKKELEEERKLRLQREKRDAEKTTTETAQIFINRLARAVPNWQEVNFDPKFTTYLQEIDEFSGQTRHELFNQAEKIGDVGRVAGMMLDYEKTNVDPLASQVTPEPTGSPQPTATTPKKEEPVYISIREIKDFHRDVGKGLIKDKKYIDAAIKAIDLAQMEGRIIK